MTIDSLHKRLSRLSEAASPMAGIALSLDMGRDRQKAREDEWQAAGNTGPVPLDPLEPPPPATARRLDRETWRKIAEARARDVFLRAGLFDELKTAYAMNDADLWQTLAQREVAACHTEG
jgi:hypothetical protein